MNPNIRTVTDLTTIPASVVQVGTLTPYGSDVLLLEYSGTAAALDAILVQAGANKDQQKIDLWVWDGTSTAPFNITAWFGKFIKVDRDASAYTGDFNLIESKLFGWEVISTGNGTGTVSGSAIGALNTISFKPITDFFVDPVVVEGNVSDNLTVLEFYNQQSGSGNGSGSGLENYIEVDKAGFLALVVANALTFPALYKITDIENGLFLETLSANTFAATGTMFAFLPNYTPDGNYKGQYHTYLGAVNNGEIYTWGEFNYLNSSGGALTPSLPSVNTFDSLDRFTRLAKSEVNHYTNCKLNVIIDDDLNITNVEHSLKLNSFDYYLINTVDVNNARAAFASLNLNNTPNNLGANRGVLVINCRVENTDEVAFFGILANSTNSYISTISNCYIVAQGSISSNVFFSDGEIKDIVGNVRVRKNTMGGSGSAIRRITTVDGGYCDVLHCHFNDNSRFEDISVTGDGVELYVWDNTLMENCDIANWTIENCGVRFANSRLNNEVNLLNFTFDTPRADLENYEIYIHSSNNITIQNLSNISLNGLGLDYHQNGANTIDLTGFTQDIMAQTIVDGVGFFIIKHNFTTNPLNSGSAALYNIIPVGAKVTSIKAYGDATGGAGATLAFGIDTDAPNLIPAAVLATVNAGQIYSLLSATATANRSLAITAGVDNVTGGSVTVLVEFMI